MTDLTDKITIKDLADELEVSKTTIRNHLQRLPDGLAVTNEDGVIALNADVVRFVRESVEMNRLKVSGKASGEVSTKIALRFPQTQFPTDETIEFLKKQLEEKDNQLKSKDEMINNLLQDLRDQQKYNLLQQQKSDQLLLENQELKSRKWWQFWK
ncbi:HTH domain-containing protein [Candidatus Enterococcus courvalinii]|uniref:HTH domain-containing protein n=1 Tax=Candidatus Enterococcus courvalinii TaxID=2815329 RepID=A0ABS3I4K9_9ENTE|nr:HTH domain-containing protein [Enterococcus sp. MSG2901]MBO0483087.1 HTH domain-containing protein [Enterococcus sp. MSG2901]